MNLDQDNFSGNRDDLIAFLKLARSPIRHSNRSAAMAEWRAYKAKALKERWRKVEPQRRGLPRADNGRAFAKGWNIQAIKGRLIDLSGINLDGVCLGFVDLRGVRLDGASLRGAWLKNAELEWASLRNAVFAPPSDRKAWSPAPENIRPQFPSLRHSSITRPTALRLNGLIYP